ncbi:hypothetical protein BOTBODRAFT_34248, partial [Botryobasidium botryosum FD-172 SS1]
FDTNTQTQAQIRTHSDKLHNGTQLPRPIPMSIPATPATPSIPPPQRSQHSQASPGARKRRPGGWHSYSGSPSRTRTRTPASAINFGINLNIDVVAVSRSMRRHRPGAYNGVVMVLFCVSLVCFLKALAGAGAVTSNDVGRIRKTGEMGIEGTGYQVRGLGTEALAGSSEGLTKTKDANRDRNTAIGEKGLGVDVFEGGGQVRVEGEAVSGRAAMGDKSGFDRGEIKWEGREATAESERVEEQREDEGAEQADTGAIDETAEVGLRGEGDLFNIVAIAEDELERYGTPEPISFASSSPLLHAARQFTLRSHHGHFHHRILSAQVQVSDEGEGAGEAWWKQELAEGSGV